MYRLAWVLVLVACGGPRLEAGVYRDGPVAFAIAEPAGWQRLSVGRSNDLAWERAGAVIQINGACRDSLDIPLVALTNHLLVGFTEREIVAQELVPMDGREALRTHVRAKLDGVARELVLHVLKKDGCVYDMALVAPPGSPFDAARASYDALLESFGTR
ncbi:MAG: hypothetical protein KF901_25745 [Myxococcales bacterium]|nr:hypothetical protein [Myxococcales bacterium]